MSDDDIVNFPVLQALKDFLYAPVEPSWFRICIESKLIPRMLARKPEEKYEVLLDGRWIYIFDSIEAAWTAAQCRRIQGRLAKGIHGSGPTEKKCHSGQQSSRWTAARPSNNDYGERRKICGRRSAHTAARNSAL
jgi:hypothetical protein